MSDSITRADLERWMKLHDENKAIHRVTYDIGDDVDYVVWAKDAVPHLIELVEELAELVVESYYGESITFEDYGRAHELLPEDKS